jgi:hypothetical protein
MGSACIGLQPHEPSLLQIGSLHAAIALQQLVLVN